MAEANGAEVVYEARSTDDPTEFRELLSYATSVADLVFTSGGISMGDIKVIKKTLTPLGAQFGHVAMQPGGPQGTAVVNEIPALSFPGNPVSTSSARRTSGGIEMVAGPGSHLVAAMARADVLIYIPVAVTDLEAGSQVDVTPLSTC